jgi:glycosyltransferase involved in cell wall biosynthesis
LKKKMLMVSTDSPYPVVVGGFERLIADYQEHVFCDHDVYLLVHENEGKSSLLHYGDPVPFSDLDGVLRQHDFEFAYFVHPALDYDDPDVIVPLTERTPCFCFLQRHPEEGVCDSRFRGVVTHFSDRPHSDVLRLGGSYNPRIFYKDRQSEDFILCVGRIAPEKNTLELVRGYRQKIYERFGLPLYLVGGAHDAEYFREVWAYVDQVSVLCTADPEQPVAPHSWRSSREIAGLCNRARMFVIASPSESFCLALVEAMSCGATCVVNGDFFGFDEYDLRPHVFGNVTAPNGTILDVLAEALGQDVRLDASQWVRKFSLDQTRNKLMPFIRMRLSAHRGAGAAAAARAGGPS